MSNPNEDNPQEPLDPRLAESLNQLLPVPPRDQQAVESGYQRFEAELSAFDAEQARKSKRNFWAWWTEAFREKEKREMIKSPKQRRVLTYAIAMILVVLLLFGGSAMTVLAAQSAIPGDALYPVKTSFEQTRFSMVGDSADRAQLQIEYAGQRLEELERLIAADRLENVSHTTHEFEAHIRSALSELERVSNQDPAQATALLTQITQSLTRYAGALSDLLANVPDPMRSDMLGALETLNASGGLQNENQNGALTPNENANDNLTGNTNVNSNENESPDMNENINDDRDDSLNENSDDSQNENTNTSVNENSSQEVQPIMPPPSDNQNDDDGANFNANDDDDDNDNGDDGDNDNDDDDDDDDDD